VIKKIKKLNLGMDKDYTIELVLQEFCSLRELQRYSIGDFFGDSEVLICHSSSDRMSFSIRHIENNRFIIKDDTFRPTTYNKDELKLVIKKTENFANSIEDRINSIKKSINSKINELNKIIRKINSTEIKIKGKTHSKTVHDWTGEEDLFYGTDLDWDKNGRLIKIINTSTTSDCCISRDETFIEYDENGVIHKIRDSNLTFESFIIEGGCLISGKPSEFLSYKFRFDYIS